jgi:anti-sigma28 factor (negative regulator of flagellin synthesis)
MAQKKKVSKSSKKPHITLNLPLDEAKIAAIQACIQRGTLSITVASVEALKSGRADDGYKYD